MARAEVNDTNDRRFTMVGNIEALGRPVGSDDLRAMAAPIGRALGLERIGVILVVGENHPNDLVRYPLDPASDRAPNWPDAPAQPLGPHDGVARAPGVKD